MLWGAQWWCTAIALTALIGSGQKKKTRDILIVLHHLPVCLKDTNSFLIVYWHTLLLSYLLCQVHKDMWCLPSGFKVVTHWCSTCLTLYLVLSSGSTHLWIPQTIALGLLKLLAYSFPVATWQLKHYLMSMESHIHPLDVQSLLILFTLP